MRNRALADREKPVDIQEVNEIKPIKKEENNVKLSENNNPNTNEVTNPEVTIVEVNKSKAGIPIFACGGIGDGVDMLDICESGASGSLAYFVKYFFFEQTTLFKLFAKRVCCKEKKLFKFKIWIVINFVKLQILLILISSSNA